jgi:hypothetical protein
MSFSRSGSTLGDQSNRGRERWQSARNRGDRGDRA